MKTLAAWLLAFGVTCAAAAPAERASGAINFVNDYAGVLSSAELRALESELSIVSTEGRYQIAAALYEKLPAGFAAEDATELADRLMVGSSLQDRGIVILGFLDRHLVRVEIGYGLEGLIPDVDAHHAAEVAAARFAKRQYAQGLADAIALLKARADKVTTRVAPAKDRWEWLPDWMLAFRDAARGFAFFAAHRHEIPKQLAVWWRSLDAEGRSVIGAMLVAGSLYLLALLRPAVGALLSMFIPLAWQRTSAMRWIFFRGTDASFERDWKKNGGPNRAAPREFYVFDVLYYGVPAIVLFGIALGAFITFVGHPGGFGGAGAQAAW